jgi:hypothetical protein
MQELQELVDSTKNAKTDLDVAGITFAYREGQAGGRRRARCRHVQCVAPTRGSTPFVGPALRFFRPTGTSTILSR